MCQLLPLGRVSNTSHLCWVPPPPPLCHLVPLCPVPPPMPTYLPGLPCPATTHMATPASLPVFRKHRALCPAEAPFAMPESASHCWNTHSSDSAQLEDWPTNSLPAPSISPLSMYLSSCSFNELAKVQGDPLVITRGMKS